GGTASGEDGHDRPVTVAEHPLERVMIGRTRFRGTSRMRVNPDPAELLWFTVEVDLVLEELGDSQVVERHERLGAMLFNQDHVLDKQQIVRFRDPESADFGWSEITQKQQFRPGI